MSTFYRVQFWRPYYERIRDFSEDIFLPARKRMHKTARLTK